MELGYTECLLPRSEDRDIGLEAEMMNGPGAANVNVCIQTQVLLYYIISSSWRSGVVAE